MQVEIEKDGVTALGKLAMGRCFEFTEVPEGLTSVLMKERVYIKAALDDPGSVGKRGCSLCVRLSTGQAHIVLDIMPVRMLLQKEEFKFKRHQPPDYGEEDT